MSGSGRPDAAFAELERLVRHLGEELAFFRRRALEAERRWREAGDHAGTTGSDTPPTREALVVRLGELERENGELRGRIDEAAERTRQMTERLRFLRQQEEEVE